MRYVLLLLFPLFLSAMTREACQKRYESFKALEKAYDAVVQSKIAAPVSVEVIEKFRKEGREIYAECRDKISTSTWYMLGKKTEDAKVDSRKFRLQSLAELKQFALSHPPVVTRVLCGSVQQGVPLPTPRGIR